MATNYQSEADKAALSQKRGKLAAGIKDPEARRKYVAAQGDADVSGNDSRQAELAVTTNKDEQEAILGSLKKGGKIKKTGLYKLHRGEKVVPAKESGMSMGAVLSGKKTKKVQTVDLGKKGSFKVRKGKLHRALGIPEGTKIPASKLAIKPTDSPTMKHMKASVAGLKAMKHGKK